MIDLPAQPPDIRIWSVFLRLRGHQLHPDLITAETGLFPCDERPPASGRRDLDGTWLDGARPGHWAFATRSVVAPGASLDEHLRIVLGAEAEAESLWRRLAEANELYVLLEVSSDPDARPPTPDEVLALATPTFAAAVRALPARLGVDASEPR